MFTMSKVPEICVSITQVFAYVFIMFKIRKVPQICVSITQVFTCIFQVYNGQSPTISAYNTGVSYVFFMFTMGKVPQYV